MRYEARQIVTESEATATSRAGGTRKGTVCGSVVTGATSVS